MVQIEEITGSIFDSTCQAIINTVNCKGYMGKGLALESRYRFPEMHEKYKKQCEKGEIKTGELTIWKNSTPWIINFPTKDDWKLPSKMEYIEKGLEFFVNNYKEWEITSIAFPRLGTSHGKLNWSFVREVMYQYLEDLDLSKIEIYEFDKTYQDKLYRSLMNKLLEMQTQDFEEHIGLRSREAKTLKTAIERGYIISFYSILNLKGFGDKSIKKIFSFAKKDTYHVQKKLF